MKDLELREEELVDGLLHRKTLNDDTFRRMMDKLQEELTLARLKLHDATTDELDVEAVLGFAEYSLLETPRLWIEFDLDQKQRFQRIVFPDGLTFDGEEFGTAVTSPIFSYFRQDESDFEEVVARTGFEPVLPA